LLMPASVGCVLFACRQAPSAAEHQQHQHTTLLA
jgi:hypothetical protein